MPDNTDRPTTQYNHNGTLVAALVLKICKIQLLKYKQNTNKTKRLTKPESCPLKIPKLTLSLTQGNAAVYLCLYVSPREVLRL